MIIWSGWGVLSALITAGAFVLSVLADLELSRRGLPGPAAVVAVWLAATALNWVVGRRLNGRPDRELVDPRTGQVVILRQRHTLFWIPMQYYSVLMLLLGALALFAAMQGGGSSGRPV
ncbi:MAG: hypothetical protein PGN34_00215 [Methylobacterium frigidaeris]